MVQTPYFKGRYREYRSLQKLRQDGWVCSRSAMSHSPVDIFAGKDGRTLLIQVKSGKSRMSKKELEELLTWANAFGAEAQLWTYGKGSKLDITRIK